MPDVAQRSDVLTLDNFIGGHWVKARTTDFFDVHNPAVGDLIGRTPLSTADDVEAAVQAGTAAFPAWRDTPVNARAQVLYRFKAQLEQQFEELAVTVTTEHGKTLDEARGSVRRGIECVEVACGAPSLMQGFGLEDISHGIDCHVVRQPLGVVAAIAPFNFPAMVPMWFLPFAIATGNTFVLKPSEQVPLSQRKMVDLLQQCGLPPGVVNLVNGGSDVVNAICDHPGIRAVSFVGSTPVAKHVYQRASHAGKRVQALGGARLLVDGRQTRVADRPNGYFVGPTVFDDVSLKMTIGHEEIFGPVASICPVRTLDEAIALINAHPNANATSIFTSSGKAAREFAKHAPASMVGVNIGVAAPMAYFPFGGAKDSFFGDLKVHGRDGIEFYTDKKVTISRWF